MRQHFSHIFPGLLYVGLLLSGCTVVQNLKAKLPVLKVEQAERSTQMAITTTYQPPVFMDALPIKQVEKNNQQPRWALKNSSPLTFPATSPVALVEVPKNPSLLSPTSASKEGEVSALQMKFSVLLEQDLFSLPDSKLLAAIDPWMGVRYRRGGTSQQGIDCSAFTASVLSTYAGIRLPRTCSEQFQQCQKVDKGEIQIGDLLFFRTRGRSVSHVGIYLGNNKFVHASSSNGVMVSSRNEPYFSSRFVGARRVPMATVSESAFE